MDDLIVIGAGPYGLATATAARGRGIRTRMLGRPMAFWREQMPAGMFLRSGPDWHLDPAGEHTLRRYLAERGLHPHDVDPIPIQLFLDYAEWFSAAKGLEVHDDEVTAVTVTGCGFAVTLCDGSARRARAVVAAPGIRHFAHEPAWVRRLPSERWSHTVDLVRFEAFAGARVLIVGGRQSAYEWAALLVDHGVGHVDIVHRHDKPHFAQVSWKFVEAHIDSTLTQAGWWRGLTLAERERITRRFWEVGRLTLEPWLTARLPSAGVHRHPRMEVLEATADAQAERVAVRLSDGERLDVDHVVVACGYRPALHRIPFLRDLAPTMAKHEGFPVLGDGLESSVSGLYLPGFPAMGSFGPFFGFVRGAPAAAELIARDLDARAA